MEGEKKGEGREGREETMRKKTKESIEREGVRKERR